MALCFLETGETWRPAKPWLKYWGAGSVRGVSKQAGDVAEDDARVDNIEALPEAGLNIL
jgi:hypothetical protein